MTLGLAVIFSRVVPLSLISLERHLNFSICKQKNLIYLAKLNWIKFVFVNFIQANLVQGQVSAQWDLHMEWIQAIVNGDPWRKSWQMVILKMFARASLCDTANPYPRGSLSWRDGSEICVRPGEIVGTGEIWLSLFSLLAKLVSLRTPSLRFSYLDKMKIGPMLHLVFHLRIPNPLLFPCYKIGPRWTVYPSCMETLLSQYHGWVTAWLVHQLFGDGINTKTHWPISLSVPLFF